MGEQRVARASGAGDLRDLTRKVLEDIRAMEIMIDRGIFESGIVRIGAEQELCLVDKNYRPAMVSPQILDTINHDHFTTELGRFNIEANLDPFLLEGDCFSALQRQLEDFLTRARTAAAVHDAEIVLTGILLTLGKQHLGLDSMTPIPRYYALDEAIQRLRGQKEFKFFIKGRDELAIKHDNVMLEACNTSFQVHLQVSPETFVNHYNVAQLVTAPVLAAAANSPLLFGHALWRETRIAVFRQAVDTRQSRSHLRKDYARVHFGNQWVNESVLEIFKEDISRYRVMLSRVVEEDALSVLAEGRLPQLKALALHNGTVYRWNRPCFGVHGDSAHLRIENRVLPSGPTAVDEIANSAFWVGLMIAITQECGDVRNRIDFEVVRENFLTASRRGLHAQLRWLDGRRVPVQSLILEELLPAARRGLLSMNVVSNDVDRLMDVIEKRVQSGQTGAQWIMEGFDNLAPARPFERCASLTSSMIENEKGNLPVAEWPPAERCSHHALRQQYETVGALMSRDLFTVNQDEVVDLAASLMDWRHIRYVPVEDEDRRLVGLVTHRSMMRWLLQRTVEETKGPVSVKEVMKSPVLHVNASAFTLEAMTIMRENKISCLPVVDDYDRLVGIITDRDLLKLADPLIVEFLEGAEDGQEQSS